VSGIFLVIQIRNSLKKEDMKRFKNTTSFITNVTELIWNYIKNTTMYPSNSKLAVQREIGETVIDDPRECNGCEFFDVNRFIRVDDTGTLVPNTVAIQNLAYRYYTAR
jgi:hypothetical protein